MPLGRYLGISFASFSLLFSSKSLDGFCKETILAEEPTSAQISLLFSPCYVSQLNDAEMSLWVCFQKKDKKPMAEWSDLPIDVLGHVTSFLPLPDYHRFTAVCKNWWLAAKQKRHKPSKQFPWLLVRGDSDPYKRRVFSISENRHYNIDLPELQGQYLCGSSYGWLFAVDIDLNLKLLNPLMDKRYDLPPLLPFSDKIKNHVRESLGDPFGITYEDAQIGFVYKAILDDDPGQRSDFTVLILHGSVRRRISFWRPGNLVWTSVEEDSNSFDDITYFKGKFYACNTSIDMGGVIDTIVPYVVDVGPDPKVTRIAPEAEVPVYENYDYITYLVDFRGELLMLWRWSPENKNYRFITRAFLIYKLDLEEGTYYRCHHLDGYSIFLGGSSTLVVDPSQFLGCNRNCIYFTAHVDCNDEEYGRDDNGIYDMVKGTISPYYPPEIYHPEIVGPIWWTPNPW